MSKTKTTLTSLMGGWLLSKKNPMPEHLVIDSDGFIYELGWCAKHDDAAKRYEGDAPDYSCWWENIAEASGHHDPRDFVGIPGIWPVRWCLTHEDVQRPIRTANDSQACFAGWLTKRTDECEFVEGGLWLPKEQTE